MKTKLASLFAVAFISAYSASNIANAGCQYTTATCTAHDCNGIDKITITSSTKLGGSGTSHQKGTGHNGTLYSMDGATPCKKDYNTCKNPTSSGCGGGGER